MKAKKYIEVENVQGEKVTIPVHQVQFVMNDGTLVFKSEASGKNIGVKLTKELIFTRYGADGFGSKTEYFFEERKGELYVLKRSTIYDPASSTYKMINETGYLKMCTIDEAIHFLKYA